MPLPQKRRRRPRTRHRGSVHRGADVESSDTSTARAEEDVFRRRRFGDEDGSSSGSYTCTDDEKSDTDTKGGAAYEFSYRSLLASLIPKLPGDKDCKDDLPKLPSAEIVEALGGVSLNSAMRAALVEFEVYKYSTETPGGNSGELNSGDDTQDMDVASEEDAPRELQSIEDSMTKLYESRNALQGRALEVDFFTRLDLAEMDKLCEPHALYRIKACMLLQGKSIDKLDDDALRTKFPQDIISANRYFMNYEKDGTFGWYFDTEFCELASLNDYQRLVLRQFVHDFLAFDDWECYRLFCNTREIDEQYVSYYKTMSEKIKWIEKYVHKGLRSDEWKKADYEASYEAMKTAISFPKISEELAYLGYHEYVWSVRFQIMSQKDLDAILFEIWKRVIKQNNSFGEALEGIRKLNKYPLRLFQLECQFRDITAGITEQIPDSRARELIAEEVRRRRNKLGYLAYATKKLKIAKYIGLV